jgi:F0F1-type ATP synthase membrane subunit b/b'
MIVVFALAEGSIQLVPDGTLVIHLLAVVAMVAILNRTLYRPINKILQDREQQTKGRKSDAQTAAAQTEKNLALYEKSLREARSAGYKRVEAERASALAAREQTLVSLREELRSLVNEQKTQLGVQAENAQVALEQESRSIAERISAQILRR